MIDPRASNLILMLILRQLSFTSCKFTPKGQSFRASLLLLLLFYYRPIYTSPTQINIDTARRGSETHAMRRRRHTAKEGPGPERSSTGPSHLALLYGQITGGGPATSRLLGPRTKVYRAIIFFEEWWKTARRRRRRRCEEEEGGVRENRERPPPINSHAHTYKHSNKWLLVVVESSSLSRSLSLSFSLYLPRWDGYNYFYLLQLLTPKAVHSRSVDAAVCVAIIFFFFFF